MGIFKFHDVLKKYPRSYAKFTLDCRDVNDPPPEKPTTVVVDGHNFIIELSKFIMNHQRDAAILDIIKYPAPQDACLISADNIAIVQAFTAFLTILRDHYAIKLIVCIDERNDSGDGEHESYQEVRNERNVRKFDKYDVTNQYAQGQPVDMKDITKIRQDRTPREIFECFEAAVGVTNNDNARRTDWNAEVVRRGKTADRAIGWLVKHYKPDLIFSGDSDFVLMPFKKPPPVVLKVPWLAFFSKRDVDLKWTHWQQFAIGIGRKKLPVNDTLDLLLLAAALAGTDVRQYDIFSEELKKLLKNFCFLDGGKPSRGKEMIFDLLKVESKSDDDEQNRTDDNDDEPGQLDGDESLSGHIGEAKPLPAVGVDHRNDNARDNDVNHLKDQLHLDRFWVINQFNRLFRTLTNDDPGAVLTAGDVAIITDRVQEFWISIQVDDKVDVYPSNHVGDATIRRRYEILGAFLRERRGDGMTVLQTTFLIQNHGSPTSTDLGVLVALLAAEPGMTAGDREFVCLYFAIMALWTSNQNDAWYSVLEFTCYDEKPLWKLEREENDEAANDGADGEKAVIEQDAAVEDDGACVKNEAPRKWQPKDVKLAYAPYKLFLHIRGIIKDLRSFVEKNAVLCTPPDHTWMHGTLWLCLSAQVYDEKTCTAFMKDLEIKNGSAHDFLRTQLQNLRRFLTLDLASDLSARGLDTTTFDTRCGLTVRAGDFHHTAGLRRAVLHGDKKVSICTFARVCTAGERCLDLHPKKVDVLHTHTSSVCSWPRYLFPELQHPQQQIHVDGNAQYEWCPVAGCNTLVDSNCPRLHLTDREITIEGYTFNTRHLLRNEWLRDKLCDPKTPSTLCACPNPQTCHRAHPVCVAINKKMWPAMLVDGPPRAGNWCKRRGCPGHTHCGHFHLKAGYPASVPTADGAMIPITSLAPTNGLLQFMCTHTAESTAPTKIKVCIDFLKNPCSFGSRCHNLHPGTWGTLDGLRWAPWHIHVNVSSTALIDRDISFEGRTFTTRDFLRNEWLRDKLCDPKTPSTLCACRDAESCNSAHPVCVAINGMMWPAMLVDGPSEGGNWCTTQGCEGHTQCGQFHVKDGYPSGVPASADGGANIPIWLLAPTTGLWAHLISDGPAKQQIICSHFSTGNGKCDYGTNCTKIHHVVGNSATCARDSDTSDEASLSPQQSTQQRAFADPAPPPPPPVLLAAEVTNARPSSKHESAPQATPPPQQPTHWRVSPPPQHQPPQPLAVDAEATYERPSYPHQQQPRAQALPPYQARSYQQRQHQTAQARPFSQQQQTAQARPYSQQQPTAQALPLYQQRQQQTAQALPYSQQQQTVQALLYQQPQPTAQALPYSQQNQRSSKSPPPAYHFSKRC